MNETEHFPGLTIRDWFAGMVIGHVLASAYTKGNLDPTSFYPASSHDGFLKLRAEEAYRCADAMLRAREKVPE